MALNKSVKLPKYRQQKRKGRNLAFVELSGHRYYLGPFGSRESKQAYKRLLAEWLANGRRLPVDPQEITVVEVIARFWEYAQQHYRRADGTPTSEPNNIRQALRPLKDLYGHTLAEDFGPLSLKAVRQKMIERGWCRTNINRMINRIRLMFKWAVENELLNPSIYHGLRAVSGLKCGRSEAKERKPIKPVPDELIERTKEKLTPTITAMVELQRLTGMRPGEVCLMRRHDIDISGSVWIYSPRHHKTQHHGRDRQVYLGPRAQSIILPFIQPSIDAYLFNPRRSEEERSQKRHDQRKTPIGQGNRPGTNRKKHVKRSLRAYYSTTAYGRAIKYACKQAFPAPERIGKDSNALKQWRREHSWSPNQLRHNYATSVRSKFGLDIAQLLLGHTKADVTQVYAEVNKGRAIQIVTKIG